MENNSDDDEQLIEDEKSDKEIKLSFNIIQNYNED